jgi:hypothetical protein
MMSRYDRSQYFEALVGLRNAYAERTDDDRSSALMIHDAATYAEAVMQALEAEESAAELEAIAAATTESMLSADPRD